MQISSRSRWQIRLQNALFVVLLVGVIGMLAWLSQQYYKEIDLTIGNRNSVTQQTRQLLAAVTQPLHFTAFIGDDPALHERVRKRINMYQRVKPDITLEIINPDLFPDTALAAGVTRQGQMLISMGERTQRVESLAEAEIGRALQQLIRTDERWIVFLEGFGKRNLLERTGSGLAQMGNLLERSGFQTQGLNLIRTPTLVDNTSVLVLPGPQNPLPQGIAQKIRDYVAAGGALLWLIEPGSLQGLDELANDLGISPVEGVIVDANIELHALLGIEHPAVIPIVDYAAHSLTRDLNIHTLFPLATAIDIDFDTPWEARPFLITLQRSWSETGPLEGELTFDELAGDRPGPLVLGLTLVREHEDGFEQRIVVIGDSDFMTNDYLGYGGNLDLAMNIFNWLSQDDSLIAINPRSAPDVQLTVSERTLITIGVSFLIILPLALLAAGIVIWTVRRRS